jgi:hypothetical protein
MTPVKQTQRQTFDYRNSRNASMNRSYDPYSQRSTSRQIIKQPKRGMMLPKRVETYEDVLKRLKKIKPTPER